MNEQSGERTCAGEMKLDVPDLEEQNPGTRVLEKKEEGKDEGSLPSLER